MHDDIEYSDYDACYVLIFIRIFHNIFICTYVYIYPTRFCKCVVYMYMLSNVVLYNCNLRGLANAYIILCVTICIATTDLRARTLARTSRATIWGGWGRGNIDIIH